MRQIIIFDLNLIDVGNFAVANENDEKKKRFKKNSNVDQRQTENKNTEFERKVERVI